MKRKKEKLSKYLHHISQCIVYYGEKYRDINMVEWWFNYDFQSLHIHTVENLYYMWNMWQTVNTVLLLYYIHTGKAPFTCDPCGNCLYSFAVIIYTYEWISLHMWHMWQTVYTVILLIYIHTGEAPFTCDTGGKLFIQCYYYNIFIPVLNLNVINLLYSYTSEKPFPCETCGKLFVQCLCYNIFIRVLNLIELIHYLVILV